MRTDGIRSGYPAGAGRAQAGKSVRRSTLARRDTSSRASDGFSHIDDDMSLYTDYDSRGRYKAEGVRVLPDRYYTGEVDGSVCYKGRTVSYVALVEEAVVSGAITLDETKDVWTNVRAAEAALIESRAKPLYPWSTTMYSEDGQCTYRVENGEITGAERAFYTDGDGRRITAQSLAEQLASGILPADVDGDWTFLARLDNELYQKALMIGTAARKFREADERFRQGQTSLEQYRNDVHVFLLYFLGRDDGQRSAVQLRVLLTDPEFGRKALRGELVQGSAASPVYRRPIAAKPDAAPAEQSASHEERMQPPPAANRQASVRVEQDASWQKPRTRRRVGVDLS